MEHRPAPAGEPGDRPGWVADAVFYQVFPDRFARSGTGPEHGLEPWDAPPTRHGYKGGDLDGITARLDWIADLGVTALYLNPIFRSTANHRYHTHDYHEVDPLLGGNAAFHRLLEASHRRGIRVVLDGVFNHASRGFFRFHDVLENGAHSPWTDWWHIETWPLHPYDERRPANYRGWAGNRALPKFDTDNPAVREYLFGVGEHWARAGIDGWRLDVPAEITTPGFWEEFRRRMRAINPDLYLVGEIWGDAHAWIADGTRFDATMNYRFTSAALSYVLGSRIAPEAVVANAAYEVGTDIEADGYVEWIEEILDGYPEAANLANLNLLDSHDTGRLMTLAGGDTATVRLALLLLLTFPGAPCLFYGTELGLEGGTDPDCRRAMPWGREETWNRDVLTTVRQLTALRHELPALRGPGYRALFPAGEGAATTVFERTAGPARALVAVNPGSETETVALPEEPFPEGSLHLRWGAARIERGVNHLRLVMAPGTGAIWSVE